MGNLGAIEEVRGAHLDGRRNADVLVYFEKNSSLLLIPTNFAAFFPNLKGISLVEVPLLRLSASDLKPFPNLVWFLSSFGQFTSIDGDLLQYTRKLQSVGFDRGKLENVGENLLNGLNELSDASFTENPCIDFRAYNPQMFIELKQKLLDQCPPFTATTMISTTVDDCLVQCPSDIEVGVMTAETENKDKVITEMQTVIDKQEDFIIELKKRNADQEQRLLELEKVVKNSNL